MRSVQALDGIKVIDMATVIAAPGAARYLADFGADVIKIEPPGGDGTRRLGWVDPADGDSYMWKLVGRGKRAIVLDLKSSVGLDRMRRLVRDSDVLIENLRPGALERLGLDPVDLLVENPGLVILRVTGFGQTGPYAQRPGFATIAEAMSGFASINGEPDGAPLPPPIALTDEVTALVGAFAILAALRHRDRTGDGQVIDVNLLDTMLALMGPLHSAWAHLGYEQPRLGSGIPYSVPRGTYQCADGRWVAISASAESVAARTMDLLGVGDDPRFRTFAGRVEHRDELDRVVAAWIGRRSADEVIAGFEAAHAAIAPVYSIAEVARDPHVVERESLIEVDGVTMPGLIARLSATPGVVRWAGRSLGADTEAVVAELDETAAHDE
ncbi:MAG: CoA transferase [Acidimicrobiia bacterium]|nr:CoA transferase [Acidimicrobiia bacterium]